jgi:phosphoribosylformylglycinamidine cyclo-ligase
MYPVGEYDLAGFAVGVVGKRDVLGKHRVRAGDVLVAIASSGLHSNGYSLARRVLEGELKLELGAHVSEFGRTLGEELLTPTRIYTAAVRDLLGALGEELHALCHVTGGGIVGNLPRVLPSGVRALVKLDHEIPAVFQVIAKGGPVDVAEMRRTFNLGIGLIAVVTGASATKAVEALRAAGERAWVFGEVTASVAGEKPAVDVA